jgi:hypothetical protein
MADLESLGEVDEAAGRNVNLSAGAVAQAPWSWSESVDEESNLGGP